jgi:hypothetical protein
MLRHLIIKNETYFLVEAPDRETAQKIVDQNETITKKYKVYAFWEGKEPRELPDKKYPELNKILETQGWKAAKEYVEKIKRQLEE